MSQDHLSIEDNSDNDGADVLYQDPILNFQEKIEEYGPKQGVISEYGKIQIENSPEFIRKINNKSQLEENSRASQNLFFNHPESPNKQ